MTPGLMWLNLGWMFMIVWIPVGTAMAGSSLVADRTNFTLYVAPMMLAALITILMHRMVLARPAFWARGGRPSVRGLAVSEAMAILYALALVVGLLLPEDRRFFAMFVLSTTGLVAARLRPHLAAVSNDAAPPAADNA
jgi:uncharacterized membrane protein